MDFASYARFRLDNMTQELAWTADDKPAMTRWQARLRERLSKLMGGLDAERIPLEASVLHSQTFAGYRRDTVVMCSRPGLQLFGYFLLPLNVDGPVPGIVCLPGHGRGVDSIIGIAEDSSQREMGSPDEYQMDFALQCVEHGYAVFALEQIGFGHRRDEQARAAGPGASSCTRDSTAALMMGESITGWRVWDAMRVLDYLEQRSEVDSSRLATMGISGGGLTSLFTGCIDERVKCCMVSGYFNTFRDSVLSINHCVDNYIPGLMRCVEMPDMAGLIAPRALCVESGAMDPIFPLDAFHRARRRASDIYSAFGVPGQFFSEVFPDGHLFHGVGAFEFMRTHL